MNPKKELYTLGSRRLEIQSNKLETMSKRGSQASIKLERKTSLGNLPSLGNNYS